MHSYDTIIVGAGPSGLALAQGCATYGQRVLVIDKERTIGGCHRVRRVDGTLFTEHGPRVYNTNYRTFARFLRNAGIDFDALFVRADGVLPIRAWCKQISIRDLACLAWTIVWTSTWSSGYGTDMSMRDYMRQHGFSERSQDVIDRICRSTDGGGADRYTCFEFFDLVHQHALYHVLEPRQPTDIELFVRWKSALEATGRVEFALGAEVKHIGERSVQCSDGRTASADRIVLAVPPESMVALLRKSAVANAFGPIDALNAWAQRTSYQDYVSFTVHFEGSVEFEAQRADSPWGVVFVRLNKYMRSVDIGAPATIVLSCIITRLDVASPHTGLTANQTLDPQALLTEAVRQLGLPKQPSRVLLSPGAFWNTQEHPNHWDDVDTAFMLVPKATFLPQHGPTVPWLWNVGCHNGYQRYHFTSLEAAVSNAAELLHKWFPHTDVKQQFPILAPIELRSLIKCTWVLVVLVLVLVLLAWVAARPRPRPRRRGPR